MNNLFKVITRCAAVSILLALPATSFALGITNVYPPDKSDFIAGTHWSSKEQGQSTAWYGSARSGYLVLDKSNRIDCSNSLSCATGSLSTGSSTCKTKNVGFSFGGSIKLTEVFGLSPSYSNTTSYGVCNTRNETVSCPAVYGKSIYAYVGVDKWYGTYTLSGREAYVLSKMGIPRSYYQNPDQNFINAKAFCGGRYESNKSFWHSVSDGICSSREVHSYDALAYWPRERFYDCRVRDLGTGFGPEEEGP